MYMYGKWGSCDSPEIELRSISLPLLLISFHMVYLVVKVGPRYVVYIHTYMFVSSDRQSARHSAMLRCYNTQQL